MLLCCYTAAVGSVAVLVVHDCYEWWLVCQVKSGENPTKKVLGVHATIPQNWLQSSCKVGIVLQYAYSIHANVSVVELPAGVLGCRGVSFVPLIT
jgi:hypothetical protein